jgi:hypothetical protein
MNNKHIPSGRAHSGKPEPLGEAARGALLHRLAPGLRHQMVAHLQPVEMIVELAKRRLGKEPVDLDQIRDGIEKIGLFSKAAMTACMNSVSWLSEEDEAAVDVGEGVRDCVAVLKSGLSFRGFTLIATHAERSQARVSRRRLRTLLTTSVFALSDSLVAPFELTVSTQLQDEVAHIRVEALPSLAGGTFFSEKPARLLDWDDLQALASAEGARVVWQERLVTIQLPLLPHA